MKGIYQLSFLLLIVFTLSSCDTIGDIFQAGIGVGIVVVVIVVAIVIWLVSRFRR